MNINFSIITCTYNPDIQRLERVITAVSHLRKNHHFEHLIIDNNSTTPLKTLLKKVPDNIKIIEEPRQGLSYARIKGAREAKGNWLVFFDDDNIPDVNYLVNLENEIIKNKIVGIWGPGEITVSFETNPPRWISKYFIKAYQEKKLDNTQFGCDENWPEYFPSGSGLSIKKSIFENYDSNFEIGTYSITGRKGSILSSGEDAQLVWNCCKSKIPVGSSPSIKLTHIIPKQRTNKKYLQNLFFHLSKGYYEAKREVFGIESILKEKPNFKTYIRKFLQSIYKAKFNLINGIRIFQIEKQWLKGFPKNT